MMLISLTLGWYSIYNSGGDAVLYGSADFGFLVKWPAFSLPILIIIVIASLSAIYSLATGQHFKQLWKWLSIMASIVLIVNLLYFLPILGWGWGYDSYHSLPRAGWVLALIGAVAIVLAAGR